MTRIADLTAAVEHALHQEFAPGCAAELRQWTHRYAPGRDGVSAPASRWTRIGLTGGSLLRRFTRGQLTQPPGRRSTARPTTPPSFW